MKDKDKQKEKLLAEESALLSTQDWDNIFNTIPDMITIHDEDFNIIKANKAAKELLDLPILEVTETKCFKYYHGTDTPFKKCPSCQCLKTKKPATFEFFEPHLNKYLEVRVIPRFNKNNKLTGLVHIVRDFTKRKRMEQKLQTMSISDELTGLFNRRGFYTFAEQQCKLAARSKKWMSLLYLDLDGMKTINDKFGHQAGDQALSDVAEILRKTFRKSDIIARIGGDEFAVLLTEHLEHDIEEIIMIHLQGNLKIHNEKGGRRYNLFLSTGLALFDPEHPLSIDELMTQADKSMYRDKKDHKLREGILPLLKRKGERRAYNRFIFGKNRWAELSSSGKVMIKNISMSGIGIKSSKPLNTNNIYTIKIAADKNTEITPKGEVIWLYKAEIGTKKDKKLPHYEAGLKFVEMNERLKSSLEKFITTFAG